MYIALLGLPGSLPVSVSATFNAILDHHTQQAVRLCACKAVLVRRLRASSATGARFAAWPLESYEARAEP